MPSSRSWRTRLGSTSTRSRIVPSVIPRPRTPRPPSAGRSPRTGSAPIAALQELIDGRWRTRALRRAEVLPLRQRRDDAGGARRRLAHVHVGPEPRGVGGHAARWPSRIGRARLVEGALRAAAVVGWDPHDGRDHGELHRARLCPAVVGPSTRRGRRRGGPRRPAADARLRLGLRASERHEGARDARTRTGRGAEAARRTGSGGSTSRRSSASSRPSATRPPS